MVIQYAYSRTINIMCDTNRITSYLTYVCHEYVKSLFIDKNDDCVSFLNFLNSSLFILFVNINPYVFIYHVITHCLLETCSYR